jgi:hypothetical protein
VLDVSPDEAHAVRLGVVEDGVKALWAAKASQRELDDVKADVRSLEEGRASTADVRRLETKIDRVDQKFDALQGKIVGAAITMAGSAVLIALAAQRVAG